MKPTPHNRSAVLLSIRLAAPLLLVGFTILYMTSLAGNDHLFRTRDSLFHADSSDYVLAARQPTLAFGDVDFMEQDGFVPAADMARIGRLVNRSALLKKARKHPLFFPVNHLCYSGFKKLVRPLRPGWTIADERRALLFPSALFGALSVTGLYLFFCRHSRDRLPALLFALLFGFSLSKWIYSSLPETYSLQILVGVGLTALIFQLRRPGWSQALLLALATGFAVLVGVNNILLVLPLFLLFLFNRRPGPGLAYALLTALTVVGAYLLLAWLVNPLLSFGASVQMAGAQVISLSAGNPAQVFQRLISVAGNHFFFSIGAIHVPRPGFTRPGALLCYLQSPLPAVFLLSYLIFLLLLAKQLITRGAPVPRDRCLTLVCWMAVHLLFYSVFNSAQPFLYSSTFLVPLITLFFFGYSGEQDGETPGRDRRDFSRGTLILLVLAVWLDNQVYVLTFLQ